VAERTGQLQGSEARLRAIVERAVIGIAPVDQEGYILDSNPALAAMLGASQEDLRGRLFTDFVFPEEAEGQAGRYRALLASGIRNYRTELRYRRLDGKVGWANLLLSFISDAAPDLPAAIALVEDVTHQKRTMEALVQAEKLSATGRMLTALAHEINNPLQAVIGCLGLARESLEDREDPDLYLQVATDELRRAAGLLAGLREVYRPGDDRREPTDLAALVKKVLAVTRGQYEQQGVQVTLTEAAGLPSLNVAPDRIQQVFLNLVFNAIDAMPGGGRLAIDLAATAEPAGVQISFADTGTGIPADVLDGIFEPFVTTKPEGSGLGLFTCHAIVEQHGGHINLESEQGRGATFFVWLPAASAST
jgi:PAS domain S-box-containing protein